ncbi:MAG: hypothetical protein JOZ24_02355 [Candidatus Eremiobacteraeota bacterium]|nr:hypothetical protein [Candidatus Eremiobacteraeota bacterium]
MKALLTAALGAALLVAATAQSPAPPASATKKPVQIKMVAENNSSENGTATLLDGAKGLIVKVRLSNAPENVIQPAHIHKGTCDKLDPKPTYPLTSVNNGQSQTTVPDVTLGQLEKGQYAINVHKSTSEAGTYVSCGNIALK